MKKLLIILILTTSTCGLINSMENLKNRKKPNFSSLARPDIKALDNDQKKQNLETAWTSPKKQPLTPEKKQKKPTFVQRESGLGLLLHNIVALPENLKYRTNPEIIELRKIAAENYQDTGAPKYKDALDSIDKHLQEQIKIKLELIKHGISYQEELKDHWARSELVALRDLQSTKKLKAENL
ncbi:MAG: hypothetical protein AB7R69_05470 [Candidatus Babeliales bacterium]